MFKYLVEEEKLKKKKLRRLFDIELEEISLVQAGANRQTFFIQKRSKAMETILEKAEEFLGTGIEKAEKPSNAEVEEAIRTLDEGYELPEEVHSAISTILKWGISQQQSTTKITKRVKDDWPSLVIPMPLHLLEKMAEAEDDEEDEDED